MNEATLDKGVIGVYKGTPIYEQPTEETVEALIYFDKLGVSLVKEDGTYRPILDILDDLSRKWNKKDNHEAK